MQARNAPQRPARIRRLLGLLGHIGSSALLAAAAPAQADTTSAFCRVIPKGQPAQATAGECSFSQRQGFVSIELANGARIELAPDEQRAGVYKDAQGRLATRQRGLGSQGQIYKLHDQTIEVRWKAPAGSPAPKAAVVFDQTLTLQGVSFHVTAARAVSNAASGGTQVRIQPSGLAITNAAQTLTVNADVVSAEVADLDVDGSPEVYVHLRGRTPEAPGQLLAFAANNRKSLSRITLPALGNLPELLTGYRGRDEFAVVESRLERRFPVYRAGDALEAPGGGMRQISYRLERGEASWQLVVHRVSHY